MVAIVAGNGLGLFNTSLETLGEAGVVGQSVFGQGSGRVFVNATSGNLVLLMQDEQLAGRGLELYALRTYNSLGTLNDGNGWRWSYEQTMRFQGLGTPTQPQAGATAIRTTGDGHETTYTWNAERAMYIGTEGPGAHDELRYDSVQGEWVWIDGSTRMMERYSNSTSSSMTGQLIRRTDTGNNSIDLTYDAGGRLTLIRDAGSQQELQLKYGLFNGLTRLQRLETRALNEDASGRATATLGGALRQVEYGHDSLGRLTTVTKDLTPADGAVFITNYTYDATTTRIASVTQSDGTSVFFTYDATGRVSTVKDHSGATSAQVTFTYDPATNSTAITDGNGQVWTYRYDATTRQLTEILTPPVDGAALSTKFQYDASGNLVMIDDARNNTVIYEYDSNGNRTLERDALGNTVTRTFSTLNQVLTETRYRTTDPDGAGAQSPGDPLTTRYVHDANSRLRIVVSAEGRVTESRYGTASVGYGLLTHTLQYFGQVYDLTGLDPAAPLTEAQLSAWVTVLPDKTKTQLTEYNYDLRGNMSLQTSYAAVNATGIGVLDGQASVTEYIYDAHSRLRQQIAVRGSARDQRTVMTSVTYDGMGRVLMSTDANGTQATVYEDANRNITVTAASGLTETRSFDSRGRLVSVRQTGDGTTRETRNVYNNADQLRMVEDAQGGRRYRFYDAAGRLVYAVDATGAVKRSEYNATGQLVRQTQYLNRADTSSWYDSATQTVTKLSLTVGGASSDVLTDATRDRVTTFDYDAAGRLTTSTDAANTVTTTGYDGASRVVMTQTADRVTRILYDKDNRKVGSVDALGYLTEYIYDAGGRLIETVRYSQRSPMAANLAAPVWIGVSNQNAIASQPFQYRMPATDADGDSLSFSFVGTPPVWLSLDIGGGGVTLKGTPPNSLTSYDVTLRADDSRGKTSDVTLRITVADSPPSWDQLPDSTVPTNATGFSLTLPPATDNESAATLLTYSIRSTLPPGLTFNAATRTFSGLPTTPGMYTITARVTDPQGLFTDRCFLLQVTNIGHSWAPVSVQVTWINQAFTFTVPPAVDPEGQALTYSVISKPSWLLFNPTTRTLSGTPPTLGLQAVVLEAQDTFGETVRLSFSIDVGNRPPTWDSLPDIVAQAGSPVDYTPPAAIDPDGELLIYSASGLPAGLLLDTTNRHISGTSNAVGVFAVTLRATDPHGASVERSFALRLNNAVPVFNGGLRDIQLEGPRFSPISLNFSFPASTFTDGNDDALTYTVSGAPGWLNFDGATRRFSGSSSIVTNQTFLVTVTASDAYGATASGSFGLSVLVKAGSFLTDSTSSLADSTSQALAAIAHEADALFSLRPTSTDGLHSYQYYDGQGRVVGSVNEQGFLSETVYDVQANKQQSLRYLDAVDVVPTDTLATLKTKAGSAKQTTTIEYDGLGRVSRRIGVDGTVMRNEYDSAGRMVRQVSADSTGEQRASRTRYNTFGEVTGTLGGVGEATLGVNPTQAAIDAAISSYGTRYEYNSLGQRIKVIDANNNPTWFYYDAEGRLSHTVNALGEVAETIYSRFGESISAHRYATRLAPAVLTTLTGGQTTPVFLAQVQALTNASEDQITFFDYDQRGLLVKQTDGLGFVTTNTYNTFGQSATQTRTIATGKTTTTQYNYNLRGELVSKTGDIGGLNFNTQTVYDAFGRITQSIDAAGKITTTSYQDNGRTIEMSDPLNRKVRSQYDTFARVLKITDASGQVTTYAYDDVNHSVNVTTPEGITTTTNKNRHGETFNVFDGRGNMTQYAYNKDGQQTTVTDALSQVIANTTYDLSGRKHEVTDARGMVTRFGYDQRNRVVEQRVDPNGLNLTTLFEFNPLGQQIKVTEGANTIAARVTTYAYDRINQLTQAIVDPNSLKLSSRYTYDGIGNTVKVEQGSISSPSQRVTLVEFDQLGRRIKIIEAPSAVFGSGSPNTRDLTTENRYDAAGRLSCSIHPDGTSTWYVYDAASQQIQTINAMGEVSENVYDANGRVAQSRRYFNRLSAADLAKLGDVISAPVTPQVNTKDQRSYFVYDSDGRQRYTLQAFIETSWTIAENRFDANGNTVETRRYDKFLLEERLNAIDTSASPGISVPEIQAELIKLGYSDADSTLAKSQRTRFAYDANNRLRFTVDALGSVSESVYDPAGQLLSSVHYATRPTLTDITESAVNAALNRADTSNQVSHYAYDAVGRLRYSVFVLTSDPTGKPIQQLVSEQAFDSLGRVVQTIAYESMLGPVADYKAATLASTITAGAQDRRSAFVYDAAGRKAYNVQVQIAGSQNIVSKLEFDALDILVGSTSYAKTMALPDFGKATLDSAISINTSAHDRTTRFVYDAVGRQRFVVGADGALSEKVYDPLGRIKESRQFDLLLSNTTQRTEDALSARRAGRTVGDGITRGEKFIYDRTGRILTTTDAAGFTETNEYNALGDKTSFTDKNGDKWRYEYDRQGRLFDQFSPPVSVQLSNETEPTNRSLQTRLYHDAFGKLFKRIEGAHTVDQRLTEYAYDPLGRQVTVVQPGWYDPAVGRVEASSAAGRFQRSLETAYDALGNQVRTKLRTGINSFQYEYKAYDNLGRVVYDVDALDNVTGFAYNTFGEQASVTRYSKSVGTLPTGIDPLWTTSALASALGNDPLARTMTMRYDNLGRKVQTIQPTVASYFFSGSSGQFVPLDNRITPVIASGSTLFEYNTFGELFHQTVQLDSTRAQENWRYYDLMGRETRAIVKSSDNIADEESPPRPGGVHTANSYDAVGNLTQVIEYAARGEADNSGNFLTVPPTPDETNTDRISSYVYDARNQQTDTLRSNLSYTTVENGQYDQVEVGRENKVKVLHTAYDGLGHVRASTDAMQNVTRSAYNSLGKLIQVTEPARMVVKSGLSNPDPFLVDSQVMTSPVTDLVLNPFGQIVKSTHSPGRNDVAGATLITSTSYDFGGNAINTTDAKGNVKNWQYDFSGRLVKETQAISSTLGRRFDAATQNLQIWRVVSHTRERRYAYDAVGHMTDVLDVFMDGPILAQSGQRKIYNAFGEVSKEQIVWGAASDALGNLQHATRLQYSYDNAGNLVAQDGADGQTLFFYNLTGQKTRAEQQGNNSTADNTHTRISETGYDLMGRTVWQSKPSFLSISGMVTPITDLFLDRWGNVTFRTEVGDHGNGLASLRSTFYEYNADNMVISTEMGGARALRADGTSYSAIVTQQTHYDLAGRAVEQIDVARDTSTLPGSLPPITLRTRNTTYDGIGQVVEQQDAEQLIKGQHGLSYAYDADGNRVATVNAVGNVFINTFDANGNQLTHTVLRLSPGGENDTYVSGSGNVPVVVLLNSHSYDQANRRIETRDYVSTLLFNANYAQFDERGFERGTFQLQETDGSLPYSEDPGRETSCVYDILGNKVLQTDDSGHNQAWSYSTAADSGNQANFTINRLSSTTSTDAVGGNHTTAYTYNDFGQIKQETYTGTDIKDPTAQNDRVYEYMDNGKLAQTTDHQTVGTPGNDFPPVVVGFGGWLDFKFLFAGKNLAGENRIYAVDTINGELRSYGDDGTPGNVSSYVVVGFGGWLEFRFLFAGKNLAGENRIYAVDTINGELRSYGDDGTPGNVSSYVVVGFGGWLEFRFLFAGKNLAGENRIFAVDPSGQLLSYGDNGTPGNVSSPVVVGFGGLVFMFFFAGQNAAGENRLYAVDQIGQLLSFADPPGTVWDLDYWSSTSTNKYTYTDRGMVATVDIDTLGSYEDFAPGGVIQTKKAQAERRTIITAYDERDRPVTVINSCFDDNGISKHSNADVTYDYDELGNHTRIKFTSFARSTPPGENPHPGEGITGRQLWFNYDQEGRMTLANKTIEQDGTVTNAGVEITYDAAGRRATTLTQEGTERRGLTSWDQNRLERYTYNDLGYLTKIEQAGVRSNKWNFKTDTPIPDDPGPSPFMPSETRSYDLLGNLFESNQYSHFFFVSAFEMTMQPQSLLVTVKNHYTTAGLLDTQSSTHPTNPSANSNTKNLYDNHGILQSYTYTKGDGLGTEDHGFKNTYTYRYSFKAGALREGGIDVESNLENSTTTRQRNTYDGRGNLVWQRTLDVPGNRELVFFDYEGSGRVLDKSQINLTRDQQAISGDMYNSFFYNASGEAVGNVPASSFQATPPGHANFGIGFTPVSPTYPSSQPSTYTVVVSDTLGSIAKSFLGDEQLWYLIANANGLTAGPTDSLESQVGRSLRIPNTVANTHNNAGTYSPYNPNMIVSNTPWVGAPLPPKLTAWEQSLQQMAPILGMETSMVLSVVLSGLGPLGVGIAAAAGDVVNQSLQIASGREFDWKRDVAEVGEAGLTGTVASGLSWLGSEVAAAIGGGPAAQVLAQAGTQAGAAAATYAINNRIHEAFHQGEAPASFSGWSLLTATAGAAATPVLGGFFSQLAQAALDHNTGWVWHPNIRAWDAFYQQLVMGLGQVVIQNSFGAPRHNSPKPKNGSKQVSGARLASDSQTVFGPSAEQADSGVSKGVDVPQPAIDPNASDLLRDNQGNPLYNDPDSEYWLKWNGRKWVISEEENYFVYGTKPKDFWDYSSAVVDSIALTRPLRNAAPNVPHIIEQAGTDNLPSWYLEMTRESKDNAEFQRRLQNLDARAEELRKLVDSSKPKIITSPTGKPEDAYIAKGISFNFDLVSSISREQSLLAHARGTLIFREKLNERRREVAPWIEYAEQDTGKRWEDISESAKSYWKAIIGHPEWAVPGNLLTGAILDESQSTDVQFFQGAMMAGIFGPIMSRPSRPPVIIEGSTDAKVIRGPVIIEGSTDAKVIRGVEAMSRRTGYEITSFELKNLKGVQEATLIAHGNETGVVIGAQKLSAYQLAKAFVDAGWEGGVIRLVTCKSGVCGALNQTFAENFANQLELLGAESGVIAPNNTAGVGNASGLPRVTDPSIPPDPDGNSIGLPLGKGWVYR